MRHFGQTAVTPIVLPATPVAQAPSKPSPTLALAGVALLLFPKAVKTVAYGAIAIYGWQLYQTYKKQGAIAAIAQVKAAASSAQAQLSDIQAQEQALLMDQVSQMQSSGVV